MVSGAFLPDMSVSMNLSQRISSKHAKLPSSSSMARTLKTALISRESSANTTWTALPNCLKVLQLLRGGSYSREELYFEPTIVYPANWSAPVMETEIFGPILPIMAYSDLESILDIIKRRPRSLAAYIFSTDQQTIDRFLHAFPLEAVLSIRQSFIAS